MQLHCIMHKECSSHRTKRTLTETIRSEIIQINEPNIITQLQEKIEV